MKCGDVCLVEYPFTDGTASKLRPVVVVSADSFNSGEDVVILPLSSKVSPDDRYSVQILENSPHFQRSGLKYPSSIKCTKPLTIAKQLLKRRLGDLAEEIMHDARTIIAELFSLSS